MKTETNAGRADSLYAKSRLAALSTYLMNRFIQVETGG